MFGFIQLINQTTKEVLQQRIGSIEHLGYYSDKVWFVKENQEIVFTTETNVTQPCKFFHPVHKDEVIHFFAGLLDTVMPQGTAPTWTGKASELETMEFSGHGVEGETWNAFTVTGEWVGTSEF